MEKELVEIPESEMTLYGTDIDSPVFLDLNEYENFPEDGIVGPVGARYWINYDSIESVEYLRKFDGKYDVFKKTDKDGNVRFYVLDTDDGIVEILEGVMFDGQVSWHSSYIESLSDTYKGFREKGIVFTYDYYGIEDEKNRERERQALLQWQNMQEYLHEIQSLLTPQDAKYSEEQGVKLCLGPNRVVAFFKNLIKKS